VAHIPLLPICSHRSFYLLCVCVVFWRQGLAM
jgi:hypothetical protein